jgi:hypothetical protein
MDNSTPSRWAENHPKYLRASSKRRAPRMNCRVPVSIEWNSGETAQPAFENGFTRVVNAYGCLLVSPRELELQQRLRVTNLVTMQEADAEVVWKGTHRPDGWDLGVKLTESLMDFWGVEF